MIKASKEFIKAINEGANTKYIARATITLADGTNLSIDNSDIWSNGIMIQDGVSSTHNFSIGAFVSKKLTLVLNNMNERFTEYDFSEAQVKNLSIGLMINGVEESYTIGDFWVDEPSYNGSLITLTCSDSARFFNKQFVAPVFPSTLLQLAQYCVTQCLGSNLYLGSITFPNSDYIVAQKPNEDQFTYADVIASISQLAGCFARIERDNKLYFDWYGEHQSREQEYDGGTFSTTTTPYSDGATIEGGDYTYQDGESYDGGTYKELENFHVLYSLKNMNIATDSFTISKIVVTEYTEDSSQAGVGTYTLSQKNHSQDTSKDDNYVISISNNRLIQAGQGQAAAEMIGERVIGLTFRPMKITTPYNPLIEAGDTAYVVDRKEKVYQMIVTSRSSTVGGGTSLSCAGKPGSKQKQFSPTELSKALSKVTEQFTQMKNAYEVAQDELMQIVAFSGGVYSTKVTQPDGSIIRYEHDKPNLADSHTVWKYTRDAKVVTQNYTGDDATTVWDSGVTASGNALFNTITAKTIRGFEIDGSIFKSTSRQYGSEDDFNYNPRPAHPKDEIVFSYYRETGMYLGDNVFDFGIEVQEDVYVHFRMDKTGFYILGGAFESEHELVENVPLWIEPEVDAMHGSRTILNLLQGSGAIYHCTEAPNSGGVVDFDTNQTFRTADGKTVVVSGSGVILSIV